MIARGVGEVLFDAEVAFGGLNRSMSQRNLDLLERRMPLVRELGKGTPEIVRRDRDSDPRPILLHDRKNFNSTPNIVYGRPRRRGAAGDESLSAYRVDHIIFRIRVRAVLCPHPGEGLWSTSRCC